MAKSCQEARSANCRHNSTTESPGVSAPRNLVVKLRSLPSRCDTSQVDWRRKLERREEFRNAKVSRTFNTSPGSPVYLNRDNHPGCATIGGGEGRYEVQALRRARL